MRAQKPRPSLRQWQRQFRRAVQGADGSSEIVRTEILSSGGVSAETRLGIYQHAYQARLLESLEEDFPNVRKLIGARRFRKISTAYLEAHPSRYTSLAEFSRDFSRFLRHRARILGLNARTLAIAQRDWLRVLLAREPDPETPAPPLTSERLSDGRFAPSPLAWVCREEGPRDTLLQRRSGTVRERRLTQAETQILRSIPKPTRLATLSRNLLRTQISPSRIQKSIAKLIAEKTLVFVPSTEEP